MYTKKYLFFLLAIALHFTFLKIYSSEETLSKIEKWDNFIANLYQQSAGKTLKPFAAVKILANDYLWQIDSPNPVLDIGCEIGKNAICLIEAGHNVFLIDVAPKAIIYSLTNLENLNLEYGIAGACNTSIERLDSQYGPFKAVVGTYVFSFIHPEKFQQVMKENVFDNIETGGYFAGGFFGSEHSWANQPELTIMSKNELEDFFMCMNLSICHLEEKKEMILTVAGTKELFHTISIIAQRMY